MSAIGLHTSPIRDYARHHHNVQSPKAHVICPALPPATFQGLLNGFCSADSPYWREHEMESSGFFSYLLHKQWLDNPIHPLERAVAHLWDRLRQEPSWLMDATAHAAHAEVWAHRRASHDAHQLHFDVGRSNNQGHWFKQESSPLASPCSERRCSADERWLCCGREQYRLTHPHLSCVLFLDDAQGQSGPTLVINQSAFDSVGPNTGAVLATPTPNAVLVFPGNLLHGVLPG